MGEEGVAPEATIYIHISSSKYARSGQKFKISVCFCVYWARSGERPLGPVFGSISYRTSIKHFLDCGCSIQTVKQDLKQTLHEPTATTGKFIRNPPAGAVWYHKWFTEPKFSGNLPGSLQVGLRNAGLA